mmetsp:Transcript_17570/g.40261  ORF Transcript_17570/g.40261 Transcript_17570/m.40261 type:complete len:110 (-) Transcript_17570:282-611(-)
MRFGRCARGHVACRGKTSSMGTRWGIALGRVAEGANLAFVHAGAAIFSESHGTYANGIRATNLMYHDKSLSISRLAEHHALLSEHGCRTRATAVQLSCDAHPLSFIGAV